MCAVAGVLGITHTPKDKHKGQTGTELKVRDLCHLEEVQCSFESRGESASPVGEWVPDRQLRRGRKC